MEKSGLLMGHFASWWTGEDGGQGKEDRLPKLGCTASQSLEHANNRGAFRPVVMLRYVCSDREDW